MSDAVSERAVDDDPEHELLWRAPPRRWVALFLMLGIAFPMALFALAGITLGAVLVWRFGWDGAPRVLADPRLRQPLLDDLVERSARLFAINIAAAAGLALFVVASSGRLALSGRGLSAFCAFHEWLGRPAWARRRWLGWLELAWEEVSAIELEFSPKLRQRPWRISLSDRGSGPRCAVRLALDHPSLRAVIEALALRGSAVEPAPAVGRLIDAVRRGVEPKLVAERLTAALRDFVAVAQVRGRVLGFPYRAGKVFRHPELRRRFLDHLAAVPIAEIENGGEP
jgi:hypothetical protein